jgi:hypothetical protein
MRASEAASTTTARRRVVRVRMSRRGSMERLSLEGRG